MLLFISECVALYNYTGEAGDLSFSEGDVIKVYEDEGEWWKGNCQGEQGLFPANYVKKRETEVHVKTCVEHVWTGVGSVDSVEFEHDVELVRRRSTNERVGENKRGLGRSDEEERSLSFLRSLALFPHALSLARPAF